jgi:predicted DNA-binding transcriptional regulator AlpA
VPWKSDSKNKKEKKMEQKEVRFLTEKQVNQMTNQCLSTLRNARHLNRGIKYCKIGRSVRYELSDVLEFMRSRKIQTEDSE